MALGALAESCVLLVFALHTLFAALPAQAQSFESPPTFHAQSLLPPALLHGKRHNVEDLVRNNGYMNSYTVDSPLGVFRASGQIFLEKRIAEIYAIDQIRAQYPTDQVLAQEAANTAKGVVTAPINAAKKAVETVSDSEKLQETAKSVPGGIAGLFKVAAKTVGSAADFAYQTGKGAITGDSTETQARLSEAGEFVEKHALDYIGYNEAYRNLAKELQVDPYTENEMLRDELRRVARLKSGAKIGGKFIPGIPGIPYVGTLNSYYGHAEQVAAYEDPKKVEDTTVKVLHSIGQGDEQRESEVSTKKLMENPAFTPVSSRLFADAVQPMAKVPNASHLVKIAAHARTREIALFYNLSVRELGKLHKSNPLQQIVTDTILPAGVSQNKELLIPLAVDYLAWTQEVATIFNRFKSAVKGKYGVTDIVVLVSGEVSPRTKQELLNLGATTVQTKVSFS